MEGYGGAKLCAGEGVHNYLEINNRRSDNESVKSQSQTNSSVAELDASIALFALSGVSTSSGLLEVLGCCQNISHFDKC